MLAISCPNCPHLIAVANPNDRLPPWCPRCGSDLKPRQPPTPPSPELAAAAAKKWNEHHEPNPAVTAALPVVDSLSVDVPAPPVHVPPEPLPAPPLFTEARLLPDPVPPKAAAPAWALMFATACGIIPMITLGGAIPTALGLGGASACLTVARNRQMELTSRVAVCTAITAGCWVALFAILNGLLLMFW